MTEELGILVVAYFSDFFLLFVETDHLLWGDGRCKAGEEQVREVTRRIDQCTLRNTFSHITLRCFYKKINFIVFLLHFIALQYCTVFFSAFQCSLLGSLFSSKSLGLMMLLLLSLSEF